MNVFHNKSDWLEGIRVKNRMEAGKRQPMILRPKEHDISKKSPDS